METRAMVFGSLNKDLILQTDRAPEEGENIYGTTYSFANGGKGANQARVFRRLGCRVEMLGKIGADAFGEELCEGLRMQGIGTSLLAESSELSGLAVITVDAGGKNRILVYPAANLTLTGAEVAAAFERSAAFDLYVSQLEMSDDAIGTFFDRARGRGGLTVLDCGPARAFDPELARGTDVVSPNESECLLLTGIDPKNEDAMLSAARFLCERTLARFVVLKLGARGSALFENGRLTCYPAIPVEAVDTTCAGDVFTAVFAETLFRTGNSDLAMRRATAGGAYAVTKLGAEASVPSPEELNEFENKYQKGNRT